MQGLSLLSFFYCYSFPFCHSDAGGHEQSMSLSYEIIFMIFVIPTQENSPLICHSDKGRIAFANQAYLQKLIHLVHKDR